jgi:hypothetical protein
LEGPKPMAVRADDIALGDLGQHALVACLDHPRHRSNLRRGIPVVKVHRAWREAAAAVKTWDGPKLVQDVGVVTPPRPLLRYSWRDGRSPGREPLAVSTSGPQSMAVCTDNVALCCLGKDLITTLEGRPTGAEGEALLLRIPVIEVHLMGSEATAAVGARDVAEPAQKRRRCGLPPSHSLDLALPMGRVVADIRWALIAMCGHAPF